MKRRISLRWLLALAFVALGAVLVVGYSLLSMQFLVRGMDGIMMGNMERAALRYLDAGTADRHRPSARPGDYQVVRRWEQLPEAIRRVFGRAPETAGILYKHDDSGWLSRPDVIYFLMRYEPRGTREGETLFVAHTGTAANASELVGHNLARSMRILLSVSLLTATALAAMVWLLLRQVSRPVTALGRWTRALDVETLAMPPPDFSYPELNDLAELIRTSLSAVQEGLEREHRFLRHASHELRTPISVIRSNTELIRKLQETLRQALDPRQAQALERIERAGLTMQHLTETLLWLSREQLEPLPQTRLELDGLIRDLIEEMRYLLADKRVEIALSTEPCTILVCEGPARIVLGNLIRNAFQHTWEGSVTIRQRGNRVEIVNRQHQGDAGEQALGFGLGLQLMDRLTARLGWPYRNEGGPEGHQVRLTLGGLPEVADQNVRCEPGRTD